MIFISYSHKDEEWKDRLVTHLGVSQSQGTLQLWEDRRIEGGEDWYEAITQAIDAGNIAILLVSANSLTSSFILKEEVPRLLQKRDAGKMRLYPIIIKPCNWKAVEWLKKMNLRPTDGRPLGLTSRQEVTETQIDLDLAKIAEEIDALVKKIGQVPSSLEHPQRDEDRRWYTVKYVVKSTLDDFNYHKNPDFTYGVILLLVNQLVGVVMSKPKIMIYGAWVGICWLLFVAARRVDVHYTKIQESSQATLSTSPTATIPPAPTEAPPSMSQKNDNSPGSQQAGHDIINNYKVNQMSKTKQDPSVTNSISNSPIINSPGSVQAPGGTVNIHHGPPTRKLTEEQQKLFIGFLRANAKGSVTISCVENGGAEACAFARQLANLLTASGWTVTSFDPMMAWGDPNKTMAELAIVIQDNSKPPERAAVLQHALKVVGYKAEGFARPEHGPDDVHLTVSTINQ